MNRRTWILTLAIASSAVIPHTLWAGEALAVARPAGIVVMNFYYAAAGRVEDVVNTRLEASSIRAAIGLDRGRVLRRINDAPELPDVIWICTYADQVGHDADMAARAGSDAFGAIRQRMGSLLSRFERTVWTMAQPRLSPDGSATLPLAGDEGSIIVTNWYFARAGSEQAVLDHRLHASDVRLELGYPAGHVLARHLGTGYPLNGALPGVIWLAEYPDTRSRQADASAVGNTAQFQAVMDHMGTLLERFDRGVWEVLPELSE